MPKLHFINLTVFFYYLSPLFLVAVFFAGDAFVTLFAFTVLGADVFFFVTEVFFAGLASSSLTLSCSCEDSDFSVSSSSLRSISLLLLRILYHLKSFFISDGYTLSSSKSGKISLIYFTKSCSE